jgi:hypothetical protein
MQPWQADYPQESGATVARTRFLAGTCDRGAPNEATAIKEAIERYGITERWQQDRLVARREA